MGGKTISSDYRYQAFISYAHKDEGLAEQLHKALETYTIPKNLIIKNGAGLSPIFRDTTELTAHHSLSEKIQEAVQSSRFLIVLCSPAAKQSHWVNEEIRLFRSVHGEGAILCVLAEGDPDASFPPALREEGREPLAAKLSGGRDGFRLGVTQLAASLLGVRLDELIQRDTKRRRNRLRVLSGASLVFAAVMGGMAWTAIDAREAAEVSRTEAEKMVEFMLTDLRQNLEPLGKLDILDDVGNRVSDYYRAIPLSDMDDDRLARQARARHLLGQVALDQRKMEKAKIEIEAAYEATAEVLRHNPNDTDAIFAHAQSVFWVGEVGRTTQNYDRALTYWEEYNSLGRRLYAIDPNNFDWIMEAAWGRSNLGLVYSKLEKPNLSLKNLEAALELFSEAHAIKPDAYAVSIEKANTLAAKATELFRLKKYEDALSVRQQEISILEKLQITTDNVDMEHRLFLARINFWEIKNTTIEKCNVTEPMNLLYGSKSFFIKDPSNIYWKKSYLSYWRDLMILCRDDFEKKDLERYISELLDFMDHHELYDSEYKSELIAILN